MAANPGTPYAIHVLQKLDMAMDEAFRRVPYYPDSDDAHRAVVHAAQDMIRDMIRSLYADVTKTGDN